MYFVWRSSLLVYLSNFYLFVCLFIYLFIYVWLLSTARNFGFLTQLLSLGGDIAIDYELSVRKSLKVGKLTIEYSWEVGQYGECDRKCNGGKYCWLYVVRKVKVTLTRR